MTTKERLGRIETELAEIRGQQKRLEAALREVLSLLELSSPASSEPTPLGHTYVINLAREGTTGNSYAPKEDKRRQGAEKRTEKGGDMRRRVLKLGDLAKRWGYRSPNSARKIVAENPDFPPKKVFARGVEGWYEPEVEEWERTRPAVESGGVKS